MFKHTILFFVLFFNFLFSQQLQFALKFDESNQIRKIISLNKNWTYQVDDEIKRVSVPFWIDDNDVVLKNKLRLNVSKSSIYFLRFEGIRGLKEVYFNDERIPFDPIDLEEFSFRIPSNIVKENGENLVKLILSQNFRIKEQNVLASQLELPERKCGAFKDIYLEVLPSFAITQLHLLPEIENNLQNGKVNYKFEISSYRQIKSDSVQKLLAKIEVINQENFSVVSSSEEEIYLQNNSINRSGSIEIKSPNVWDVSKPSFYIVRIQLYQDGSLIDQITSNVSFRKIELKGSKVLLNNKPISLKGVTYFESNGIKNSFFNLKDYERDLNLIKDLGVNAIFVKNSLPSDELLYECEKNGILVFFDLDSKVYPSNLSSQSISEKIKKLNFVIDKYSNYGCVVGLNLGIINQIENQNFINSLLKRVDNSKINFLKFVEANDLNLNQPKDVDFVAYNLLHKSINQIEKFVSNFDEEKFILISSIGYNHGLNEEEGYSNPYSVQAQAKYLSDALKIFIEKDISFFVHTFSDFRLSYHSIISGKIDNKLMKYGLVNEYRDKKKLSYYTFKSYLNESKLPLIMQGDFTEKANIIYVVAGLLFLAMTIITINSTHRFRENVSRAVLKTYNFFSDIRDGWFISSFHSIVLGLTIALSTSLTYSSLLYYWKDKIEFEKFVSLFNSKWIFEFVSYVSWRPIEAIICFTLILIIWIIFLTILIKFFNLFVKNKIFLNHAFLISIWSAIPFLILIPLGMVAFKVLSFQKYNSLIYAIVIFFHLWVITRTLKGISIVFEIKKSKVYLNSILFLIIVLASLILYLQINFSSIDYFMEYFG